MNSSHYSYKSCEDKNLLRSKCSQTVTLLRNSPVGRKRPLINSLLKEKVKSSDGYVLLFDESLTHELQN